MSDQETQEIVRFQQRLQERLRELKFHDGAVSQNVAHHLAEIAVLGRNFADTTLPLFLSMSAEHTEAVGQLAVSIKCDLDEIRDAISDVLNDVVELMQFLNGGRR
jgi:hypothetical protein